MIRVLLLVLFIGTANLSAAERDPAWAEKLDHPGLPNLHRVGPNLYRCAQPTEEGLRAAEKLGIKTVINLRGFHSDKDEAKGTQLKTEHIRFHTWNAKDAHVVQFLKIISDTNAGPFLVHCKHGADRTGTMTAIYRVAVQGWTKDEAIREMTKGGFGYHAIWRNLIRYLRKADVDALQKQAEAKAG